MATNDFTVIEMSAVARAVTDVRALVAFARIEKRAQEYAAGAPIAAAATDTVAAIIHSLIERGAVEADVRAIIAMIAVCCMCFVGCSSPGATDAPGASVSGPPAETSEGSAGGTQSPIVGGSATVGSAGTSGQATPAGGTAAIGDCGAAGFGPGRCGPAASADAGIAGSGGMAAPAGGAGGTGAPSGTGGAFAGSGGAGSAGAMETGGAAATGSGGSGGHWWEMCTAAQLSDLNSVCNPTSCRQSGETDCPPLAGGSGGSGGTGGTGGTGGASGTGASGTGGTGTGGAGAREVSCPSNVKPLYDPGICNRWACYYAASSGYSVAAVPDDNQQPHTCGIDGNTGLYTGSCCMGGSLVYEQSCCPPAP